MAKLGFSDHFEILDLHWSAYGALIEEAYHRDMVIFDRRSVPEELLPKVEADLVRIRQALDEARRVLANDATRVAYRKSFVNTFQLKSGVELYMEKGETALLRRNHREAMDCFKRVLELDPSQVVARQHLAGG